EQVFEQLEFASGELQHVLAPFCATGHQVQLEVRCLQAEHFGRTATTKERPNARQKFRQGKWLDEVVIGAQIHAQDTIIHTVARSENEHRRFDVTLPERLQDFESAASRQHQVEHNKVEDLGIRAEKPILTCPSDDDLVM